MHNTSGKAVHYLRVVHRKTRGRLSPAANLQLLKDQLARVQVRFVHYLSDLYTPYLSPANFPVSPLIEHYLYPVSTAPINNPTKEN